LFEDIIKVVGIATGYPDTVDDKQRVQIVLRQFQFKELDQIDKAVGLFRVIVEFFRYNALSAFSSAR
jgi:hypothetical protein